MSSRLFRSFPFAGYLSLISLLFVLSGCDKAPEGGSDKASAAAKAPAIATVNSPNQKTAPQEVMPRKIIYTATVDMNTTDFKSSAQKLSDAVTGSGGYIAETNINGAPGEAKHGVWKVRVPVTKYDLFIKSLSSIGEVSNSTSTSQDVSEEFYDIDARLKNKRVEEARLLKHLDASTGKLSEILTVEKEISRVREEIERMEGRQRFLANQTDFTTVTITINELASLKREETPSFVTQIQRVFVDSLIGLGEFTKGIVIALVALLPWVVVAGGIGFPIWHIIRKRRLSETKQSQQERLALLNERRGRENN